MNSRLAKIALISMKNTKNSICVVVCYMGKLPWYFDYFKFTAEYNHSIDFLIISDDLGYDKRLPSNVKIVYSNLQKISEAATNVLSFEVTIRESYKLCDYKPLYGLIFEEHLKKYDFWGHGDIDVIFGDIRNFITDEILSSHDVISVRHDFLTGYFLLFRNTPYFNRLFEHSKDYKMVFSSDIHYCFDETNHEHGAFADAKHSGANQEKIISEIESMNHVVLKLQREEKLRAYFDLHVIEGVTGNLRWQKGKLFYMEKFEILLYHMILFKKICGPKESIEKLPKRFEISSSDIIEYF